MLNYVHNFLFALSLTVAIESIVLFLLFYFALKEKSNNIKIFFAGLFASFATLPYVWFVFPTIFYTNLNIAVGISEIFVIIVEGIFYHFLLKLSWKKAFLVSLICNVISFGIGKVVF